MADEKQEVAGEQKTAPFLTWREFLDSYPMNASKIVSDYYRPSSGSSDYTRLAPHLRLYCTVCEGVRNFTGQWIPSYRVEFDRADLEKAENLFLEYKCKDCDKGFKVYCLRSVPMKEPAGFGWAVKVGEFPEYHVELPRSLKSHLGDDYELFLKGLTCEKQGLGIGAFTYYRRVVESQKSQLIEEIRKVAEKLNAPKDALDDLAKAAKENQFARAVEMIKDAIPQALLVDSQNPLKLLHDALSIGVHSQTDASCLTAANAIRLVLADFSERLKLALQDQKELRAAIGSIAKFVGDARKNNTKPDDSC
jgi:hypothetical protein